MAALRMAAKAAGYGEAVAAAAGSRGIAADLPHPDTLLGTLLFESGAPGTRGLPAVCPFGSTCLSDPPWRCLQRVQAPPLATR